MSEIFSDEYLKASLPSSAINRFREPGIVSFNPDVSVDIDFPVASITTVCVNNISNEVDRINDCFDNPVPGTSSKVLRMNQLIILFEKFVSSVA